MPLGTPSLNEGSWEGGTAKQQFRFESPETGRSAVPSDAAGIGTASASSHASLGVHTLAMRACMEGPILKQQILSAAIAAALVSSPLFAQDELEETVITATRTPVPLDALTAPVIIISRSDIERSLATDVSELLHAQAGLEISRNGGPGQTTTLFTRGTDSNHTVVLIDGVRINPGTIGGAALHNIAPESIERIEIVKGPRSSLWHRCHWRRVQLFTRGEARDGFSAGATTAQLHAATSPIGAITASDRLRFGLGGSYGESEGMPVFVDSTSNRGYRNLTGRANLEFAATEKLSLRARVWQTTGRTEYSEQDFFSGEFIDRSSDFENSVYSIEGDFRADSGLGVRVTASRAPTTSIERRNLGTSTSPHRGQLR